MATATAVPPIVMEFLVDKAIEAMESGAEVTFTIHPPGPMCGNFCLIHSRA